MLFQPQTIYHIYNQGNNRQRIFYTPANYLYFLRTYLYPHVDFLAYCLMPNHFHWLVYARESACTWLNLTQDPEKPIPLRQELSHQINIALRTYTPVINNQEHRTGSWFRQHTKGKSGDIRPLKSGRDHRFDGSVFGPNCDYGWNYSHYLHNNPWEAGR